MLCMFCQGSTMNFIDLFIVDKPFSKHLLCFLQSQKHTNFICKVDTTSTPALEEGGIMEKQR